MKMQNIQTEIINGLFNSHQQNLILYVIKYKFFTVDFSQSNNDVYEQTKATIIVGVKTNFGDDVELQDFLNFARSFSKLFPSNSLDVNFSLKELSDLVSALIKFSKVEKIEYNEKMRGIKVKIFNNLFFQADFKVIEAEYKILGQEIQSDLLDELNNLEFFDTLDGRSAAKIAWLAKLLPVSEITKQVGLLKNKKLTEEAAFNLFILLNHCYSITQEESEAVQYLIVEFEAQINHLINVDDQKLFLNLKIKQALTQEHPTNFVTRNKQFLEEEYDEISCCYVLHCFDDINPFKACTFEELTALLIFLEHLIKLKFPFSMHIDIARLNQDHKYHQAVKVLDKLKEYFTQEDYEKWDLNNFQRLCYALQAITRPLFTHKAFMDLKPSPGAVKYDEICGSDYQQVPFALRYLNAAFQLFDVIDNVGLKSKASKASLVVASRAYQSYVFNTDHTREPIVGFFHNFNEYNLSELGSNYVYIRRLRATPGIVDKVFHGTLLSHLFAYHRACTWLANLIFTKNRDCFEMTQELFDAIEEIARKIISASNNLSAWANICHRLLDTAYSDDVELMRKINQTKASLASKITPNYAAIKATQVEGYKPHQPFNVSNSIIKSIGRQNLQINYRTLREAVKATVAAYQQAEKDKLVVIDNFSKRIKNTSLSYQAVKAFVLGDLAPLKQAIDRVDECKDAPLNLEDVTFDPNDSSNDEIIKKVAQCLHEIDNPKPFNVNVVIDFIGSGPKKYQGKLINPYKNGKIAENTDMPFRIQALRKYIEYVCAYVAEQSNIDESTVLVDIKSQPEPPAKTFMSRAEVHAEWGKLFPGLAKPLTLKAWRNFIAHDLKPLTQAMEAVGNDNDLASLGFVADLDRNDTLQQMVVVWRKQGVDAANPSIRWGWKLSLSLDPNYVRPDEEDPDQRLGKGYGIDLDRVSLRSGSGK